MKDLRIVIPAYNEEESIAKVINQTKTACPDAEVIIVDDRSTDKTAIIALDHNVIVINNPNNLRKGGATKVGLNYQSTQKIKYLAFIDADCTYPPESIPAMYDLGKKATTTWL